VSSSEKLCTMEDAGQSSPITHQYFREALLCLQNGVRRLPPAPPGVDLNLLRNMMLAHDRAVLSRRGAPTPSSVTTTEAQPQTGARQLVTLTTQSTGVTILGLPSAARHTTDNSIPSLVQPQRAQSGSVVAHCCSPHPGASEQSGTNVPCSWPLQYPNQPHHTSQPAHVKELHSVANDVTSPLHFPETQRLQPIRPGGQDFAVADGGRASSDPFLQLSPFLWQTQVETSSAPHAPHPVVGALSAAVPLPLRQSLSGSEPTTVTPHATTGASTSTTPSSVMPRYMLKARGPDLDWREWVAPAGLQTRLQQGANIPPARDCASNPSPLLSCPTYNSLSD